MSFNSGFGIYVHIPYCLQRCVYCDFATYEFSQILGPSEYIKRVQNEIKTIGPQIRPRPLDTLYFGGGTPSLIDPPLLEQIFSTIKDVGFTLSPKTEVTIEINPATINEEKLKAYLQLGFNRFSVGAQTFDDTLLKQAHRQHSAQDTIETLSLLKSHGLNYSFDLLFALPTQDLSRLQRDLDLALGFDPFHVSPYCLTVPESNPMAKNRALESTQVEMFDLIRTRLETAGVLRYEISNFAKPGFESRHNNLYWNDDEYWGVGLSSHSYMHWGDWGTRFWNSRSIDDYTKNLTPPHKNPNQSERLEKHQALTDFFHTALRRTKGLNRAHFFEKFGASPEDIAAPQLKALQSRGLLKENPQGFSLTDEGIVLSNKVFQEFTFLRS